MKRITICLFVILQLALSPLTWAAPQVKHYYQEVLGVVPKYDAKTMGSFNDFKKRTNDAGYVLQESDTEKGTYYIISKPQEVSSEKELREKMGNPATLSDAQQTMVNSYNAANSPETQTILKDDPREKLNWAYLNTQGMEESDKKFRDRSFGVKNMSSDLGSWKSEETVHRVTSSKEDTIRISSADTGPKDAGWTVGHEGAHTTYPKALQSAPTTYGTSVNGEKETHSDNQIVDPRTANMEGYGNAQASSLFPTSGYSTADVGKKMQDEGIMRNNAQDKRGNIPFEKATGQQVLSTEAGVQRIYEGMFINPNIGRESVATTLKQMESDAQKGKYPNGSTVCEVTAEIAKANPMKVDALKEEINKATFNKLTPAQIQGMITGKDDPCSASLAKIEASSNPQSPKKKGDANSESPAGTSPEAKPDEVVNESGKPALPGLAGDSVKPKPADAPSGETGVSAPTQEPPPDTQTKIEEPNKTTPAAASDGQIPQAPTASTNEENPTINVTGLGPTEGMTDANKEPAGNQEEPGKEPGQESNVPAPKVDDPGLPSDDSGKNVDEPTSGDPGPVSSPEPASVNPGPEPEPVPAAEPAPEAEPAPAAEPAPSPEPDLAPADEPEKAPSGDSGEP